MNMRQKQPKLSLKFKHRLTNIVVHFIDAVLVGVMIALSEALSRRPTSLCRRLAWRSPRA